MSGLLAIKKSFVCSKSVAFWQYTSRSHDHLSIELILRNCSLCTIQLTGSLWASLLFSPSVGLLFTADCYLVHRFIAQQLHSIRYYMDKSPIRPSSDSTHSAFLPGGTPTSSGHRINSGRVPYPPLYMGTSKT